MNLEQAKALGLNDEDAKKVVDASAEELKGFVPKNRFDEVNSVKKQLETDLKERDTQLEKIKETSGNSEELKKQIETLQAENRAAKEKFEAEMKEMKISNAVKISISGVAQDADLVAGLFDKSKLIYGDDGKVTGLEEQLKALKESKPFLFKEENSRPPSGIVIGGQGQQGQPNSQQVSMKDAIAAQLQIQKN